MSPMLGDPMKESERRDARRDMTPSLETAVGRRNGSVAPTVIFASDTKMQNESQWSDLVP